MKKEPKPYKMILYTCPYCSIDTLIEWNKAVNFEEWYCTKCKSTFKIA